MEHENEDPIGNRIREVEEKNDLLKFQIDGWCIWHYFRPAIGAGLLFKDDPLPLKEEFPAFQRIKLALKGMPILLFPGKADYFVLTCSSDRNEMVGSKRQNNIFDILLKDLNSYFIIETINNKKFIFSDDEVCIKSNMTTELLFGLSYCLAKLYIPLTIKRMAKELSKIIQNELGLLKFTPELVADWCMYFFWLKKMFYHLLRKVDPHVVFVGSGGASYIFAAAKELGVKVIEFQHGTLDHFNPAYSWSSYAVPYKAKLPIPNSIFVSSDFVKKELMKYGFWTDKEIRPVGSIRVDQYRYMRKNVQTNLSDVCQILLTTGTNPESIIEFILVFLRISKHKKISLTIKTHPVYEGDGAYYKKAFVTDNRVKVITGNESPSTFELLAKSDFHISVCSSCHYDSLALGTPTIILGLPCYELFLPLYQAGYAFLAKTPEDLLNIMTNNEKYVVPGEVSELFFKSGALNNIKRELNLI